MKYILYPFYVLYQYLIAWPLLALLTMFTAIFTVCTVHWRNAEFVHKVQQFWSRSFFWLMFLPVSVDGIEHIEPKQSYVFVANHQSMFDVWLVYGWLPVIFKWLMKAELRKVPFVGTGCKAAGHIFVDRRNAKAAMESLKEVEKQLVDGVCTVIFPEGTRSLNGEVGRFKRGAFQIALELGLPVILQTSVVTVKEFGTGQLGAMLRQLEINNRIFILKPSGELSAFVVYANEKIAEDDAAGLERIANAYPDSLTLITCEDERAEGGYTSRRIVAARKIRN